MNTRSPQLSSASSLQSTGAPGGLLQRQCACGQHSTAGAECEECKKKNSGLLQRSASGVSTPSGDFSLVHNVLHSPGHPLDSTTRRKMDCHFGEDFRNVRLHTDRQAAQSAAAVNALAYTVGRHIVFGDGAYSPGSESGARLLRHELVHTMQQKDSALKDGAAFTIDPADSPLETQAQAAQSDSAKPGPFMSSTGGLFLQRAAAPTSSKPGGTTPAPAAPGPSPSDVIAIRLDHQEAGGLGRFDTLLFGDCRMKIQFRMNFNFTGPWPNEKEKKDWQARFITSVKSGWSGQYGLESTGACKAGCPKVSPFIEIYAPHSSPHVVVDVAYTDHWIQSRAGYGGAHLDSLDLRAEDKGGPEKQVGALHEFGHLTGRPDQYQPGGCAPGYPPEGVMCMGSTVTDKDYQPFANALSLMTGCSYRVIPGAPKKSSGLLGSLLGVVLGGAAGAGIGAALGGGVGALIGGALGMAAGYGVAQLVS